MTPKTPPADDRTNDSEGVASASEHRFLPTENLGAKVIEFPQAAHITRLRRVLTSLDAQASMIQSMSESVEAMGRRIRAKLDATNMVASVDTPLAEVGAVGIDFLELVTTPIPPTVPDFELRVHTVARALSGLDRHGIHEVLESAGRLARTTTRR